MAKYNRSEAVEYLAGQGFHFRPGHKYTDTYLKRTERSYRKQQAEGIKNPSLSRARGHGEVQHIPRHKRIKEQYAIGSKERHATKKDVEHLRKEAGKGTRTRKGETPEQYTQRTGKEYRMAITTHEREQVNYVTGNITGELCVVYGVYEPGEAVTLSFHVPEEYWNQFLSQSSDTLDFANKLSKSSDQSIEWCEVYSINIT